MPFAEHFSAWASGVGLKTTASHGWFDLPVTPHLVFVDDLTPRSPTKYFGDYRYGAYLEPATGPLGFQVDRFVSLWAETDVVNPARRPNYSLYGAVVEL